MGIGIIGSNWSVNEHTADFLAFANMEALFRIKMRKDYATKDRKRPIS